MISRVALRIRWRKGVRISNARSSCGQYPRYRYEYSERRNVGMLGTTPCLCSCWMCGNPRRRYGNSLHGLTLQERKAMEAVSDE